MPSETVRCAIVGSGLSALAADATARGGELGIEIEDASR
jgi:hypothetical protein